MERQRNKSAPSVSRKMTERGLPDGSMISRGYQGEQVFQVNTLNASYPIKLSVHGKERRSCGHLRVIS